MRSAPARCALRVRASGRGGSGRTMVGGRRKAPLLRALLGYIEAGGRAAGRRALPVSGVCPCVACIYGAPRRAACRRDAGMSVSPLPFAAAKPYSVKLFEPLLLGVAKLILVCQGRQRGLGAEWCARDPGHKLCLTGVMLPVDEGLGRGGVGLSAETALAIVHRQPQATTFGCLRRARATVAPTARHAATRRRPVRAPGGAIQSSPYAPVAQTVCAQHERSTFSLLTDLGEVASPRIDRRELSGPPGHHTQARKACISRLLVASPEAVAQGVAHDWLKGCQVPSADLQKRLHGDAKSIKSKRNIKENHQRPSLSHPDHLSPARASPARFLLRHRLLRQKRHDERARGA
jgi:hypothetical protein